MKTSTSAFVLVFSLFLLVTTSCQRDDCDIPREYNAYESSMPQLEMIPGTWWTYRDTLSGDTDSIEIYQNELYDRDDSQIGPGCSKKFSRTQYFQMKFEVHRNGKRGTFSLYDFNFYGDDLEGREWGFFEQSFACECPNPVYETDPEAEGIFETITIGGNAFTDVKHTIVSQINTLGHTFEANHELHVWFDKNVGVIRHELRDTSGVVLEVWDIENWDILL